jgi:hypothetical protein
MSSLTSQTSKLSDRERVNPLLLSASLSVRVRSVSASVNLGSGSVSFGSASDRRKADLRPLPLSFGLTSASVLVPSYYVRLSASLYLGLKFVKVSLPVLRPQRQTDLNRPQTVNPQTSETQNPITFTSRFFSCLWSSESIRFFEKIST